MEMEYLTILLHDIYATTNYSYKGIEVNLSKQDRRVSKTSAGGAQYEVSYCLGFKHRQGSSGRSWSFPLFHPEGPS